MFKAGMGLVAAGILVNACGALATETQHETKAIDLAAADAARVELRMGAGELRVRGGTPRLLEADFTYNAPSWKPNVEYRSGPKSELTISQPGGSTGFFGRTVNTWNLTLNAQVPLDVVVKMGAGEADLKLGETNLSAVDISLGAGELRLDLRGEPRRDYSVRVQGGAGEATIALPRDVGIAAAVAGGVGEISTTGLEKRGDVWINPERESAPVTVRLDVRGGVGTIRLER